MDKNRFIKNPLFLFFNIYRLSQLMGNVKEKESPDIVVLEIQNKNYRKTAVAFYKQFAAA